MQLSVPFCRAKILSDTEKTSYGVWIKAAPFKSLWRQRAAKAAHATKSKPTELTIEKIE